MVSFEQLGLDEHKKKSGCTDCMEHTKILALTWLVKWAHLKPKIFIISIQSAWNLRYLVKRAPDLPIICL